MDVHQLPRGEGAQAAPEGCAPNNTKRRRCHISSATDSLVRNGATWERGKHQICLYTSAVAAQHNMKTPSAMLKPVTYFRTFTLAQQGGKQAHSSHHMLPRSPFQHLRLPDALSWPCTYTVTRTGMPALSGDWVHGETGLSPRNPWNNKMAIISLTNCSTLDYNNDAEETATRHSLK